MTVRTALFIFAWLFAAVCYAQPVDWAAALEGSATPAVTDSGGPADTAAGAAAAPAADSPRPLLSNDTALVADIAPGATARPDTAAALPVPVHDTAARPFDSAAAVPFPGHSDTAVRTVPIKAAVRSPRKELPVHLLVPAGSDIDTIATPSIDLTLDEAVDRLLDHNPDVNRARLEWLSGQEKFIATFGLFEPALVGGLKHETTKRPSSLLDQMQNTYTGGIEGVLPSATKYNLNFSLTDLRNNFPWNYNKPTTFAGLTLTQPLLQGFWFGKPLIDVRSARIEREISLQKYRSALSAKLYELEDVYWKLCYAHEKLAFTQQSVQTAQEIVNDSKLQERVGKISHVEALEAAADLATRLSNRADAQKELVSAVNDLKLLLASKNSLKDTLIRASTPLDVSTEEEPDDDCYCGTLPHGIDTVQPDYLQKKYELDKEQLALDYQSNQCLPELNLKGSLGYVVTGNLTDDMWLKFRDPAYRSRCGTYSAELEFRLPLGLNLKERRMRAAEKHNVRAAEIDLHAVRIQIENYLSVSCRRMSDLRKNLDNAKIVVDYRKTLLKAEIVSQKAGTSNYRKVFQIEEDLTKSQQWQLENMVDYNATRAQLARLTGMTLIEKGLETVVKGKTVLIDRLTGLPDRK